MPNEQEDVKFLKWRSKILAVNTGDKPDLLDHDIVVPAFRGYTAGDLIRSGTPLKDIINIEFNTPAPQPKVTIVVSPTGGGTTNPSGTQTVNYGADFNFTSATPNTGYQLKQITVGGEVKTAPFTIRNVTADLTVNVEFEEIPTVTHTITASAGVGGSINPSGAVTVADGGSQAFSIAPDSGYHIKDVKVDGASVGGITTYPFTNVTADHTIEAEFEQDAPDKYTITVTDTTTGISDYIDTLYPAVGSHEYGAGQTLTASATAKTGFVLTEFKVDGTDILPNTTYTFSGSETDAGQSHTISVKFEAAPAEVYHVVIADATDSSLSNYGTISPAVGTHDVAVGSSQDVTATPNSGFKIKSFKVDSTEQAISDPTQAFTYTVSGIAADATVEITVEFEEVKTQMYESFVQRDRAWTRLSENERSARPNDSEITLGDPIDCNVSDIKANGYNFTTPPTTGKTYTQPVFIIPTELGMPTAIDQSGQPTISTWRSDTITIGGTTYTLVYKNTTINSGQATYNMSW